MSSVGSDYIPKDTDVPHLVKCLASMSHQWEELGLVLDLPWRVQKQCRSSSNILSLEKILSEWVKGQGLQPASLSQLVEALAGDVVSRSHLAAGLISEFNKVLEKENPPSLPEGSRSRELAAADLDHCKFSLRNLTLLQWTDRDGQPQTLRVRDELSVNWHFAADLLGLTPDHLQFIERHHEGDVRQCCRDVLVYWIKSGSHHYPSTWEGLIQLLVDLQLNSTADTLKCALSMS